MRNKFSIYKWSNWSKKKERKLIRRIFALEMLLYKRMHTIPWTEHVINEEVLETMAAKKTQICVLFCCAAKLLSPFINISTIIHLSISSNLAQIMKVVCFSNIVVSILKVTLIFVGGIGPFHEHQNFEWKQKRADYTHSKKRAEDNIYIHSECL